jgi:hypothetical protein
MGLPCNRFDPGLPKDDEKAWLEKFTFNIKDDPCYVSNSKESFLTEDEDIKNLCRDYMAICLSCILEEDSEDLSSIKFDRAYECTVNVGDLDTWQVVGITLATMFLLFLGLLFAVHVNRIHVSQIREKTSSYIKRREYKIKNV